MPAAGSSSQQALGLVPLALLLALAASGCGRAAPVYPAGPLVRPILGIDEAGADAANHAIFPAGFTGPLATTCSADPTRAFLGELANHPPAAADVLFHWAPVIPGPVAGESPLAQPELFAAGTITGVNLATLDTSFDHPLGFDFNMDVAPDAPFQFLVQNRTLQNRTLHTELEQELLPQSAFGFSPAAGDRVVMRGAWILDCGHPPYETEMHPPGFLAFARAADATTTIALALAVPWRTTQLFGPAAAATDLGDPRRFLDAEPFPHAFFDNIAQAAATGADHLEAHALLEALRFTTLSFTVCAPSPRPAHATLAFSQRFTVRTGVTLSVTPHDDTGCVDYSAAMSAAYAPQEPMRTDYPWPWDVISQQASDQSGVTIDVRAQVLADLRADGFTKDIPALHADHPPVIDTYPPLPLRADAALDSPAGIATGADDQPYPFAGRARVWWGRNQ